MRNLKEEIKEEYKSIDITEEKSEIIFNNILNNYNKKKKTKKVLFSFFLVSVIMIFGFGITYADEIKENINRLKTSFQVNKNEQGEERSKVVIESDAIKELNYDANLEESECATSLDDKCLSVYTYEELEKELNVKLLKSDLFKKEKFILKNIKKVDGKIAVIELRMFDALVSDVVSVPRETKVDLSILMRTKYCDNSNTMLSYGYYTEYTIPKYYVNNLQTLAYGIEYSRRRSVYLNYDNVIYRFFINPSMKTRDEPDKEVQRILDSLHY